MGRIVMQKTVHGLRSVKENTTMESPTIPALRRAIEGRDGAALAGFYADDAVLRIVDQDHPPSQPLEISGHDAIAAYFGDVCGRIMTHEVAFGIAEGDRLAFTQACTYPDGKRVFCSATLELANGRIARQVAVQAWDA
jgi:ketosteroid isomerase-like protein